MTRINCDLSPAVLMDQHLMAEYRELPMVYAALRRSLYSKNIDQVLRSIPEKFTLNAGHVTFFYDKLEFLQNRYQLLINELQSRNFKLDATRVYSIDEFPSDFKKPCRNFNSVDRAIIVQRIKEKIAMKPDWYRYRSEKISDSLVEQLYSGI